MDSKILLLTERNLESVNREKSGNFGKVACFSTQTYKHINSGEGGIITTNDPKVAARRGARKNRILYRGFKETNKSFWMWCNVSMTDHSLNETLDFFKHVVKVHNES